MRRIKLQDIEPPRLLTEAETAHLLGIGAANFSQRAKELEAKGLPPRNPIFGKRDRKAIELWLDKLSGLTQQIPAASPSDISARLGED